LRPALETPPTRAALKRARPRIVLRYVLRPFRHKTRRRCLPAQMRVLRCHHTAAHTCSATAGTMSFFDYTLYTCQLPDDVSEPHVYRPAEDADEAQRLNARVEQEQVGALSARLEGRLTAAQAYNVFAREQLYYTAWVPWWVPRPLHDRYLQWHTADYLAAAASRLR
jgi:hypothetical protein